MGAKNGTEQAILSEIIAQQLTLRLPEARIERHFGIATTELTDAAFRSGEIDLYPEYLGTALTAILHLPPPDSREGVRELVRGGYRETRQAEWFGPLGFDSPWALVVREETAAKLKARTLSAAAEYPGGWVLGMTKEFQERLDGLPVLRRTYRLEFSAPPRILARDGLYSALAAGAVNVIAGNGNDAAFDAARHVWLTDDKGVFSNGEAGVVVKTATLQRVAGLADALKALNGKLTAERMRAMNRRVDLDHAAPEQVVTDFLKGSGI